MRVSWTARRSNESILKEINPEYSLEGLMLKLKLQYFGHLMRRVDSLKKTLMLGRIGGRRRKGRQRMRWLDGNNFQSLKALMPAQSNAGLKTFSCRAHLSVLNSVLLLKESETEFCMKKKKEEHEAEKNIQNN